MSEAALGSPTTERAPDPSGPWPLLPWLIPVIVVSLSRLQVGDLAYQLRAGDIMWHTTSVLRTDVFTFTIPGAPWLDQQWGAQIVLSRWFAALGWRGLLFFQAAIVAGSFGATYRRTVANGASALVASCATLIGFGAAASLPGALALRPQLLALPLFVTSAWIIGRRGTQPTLLYALIPIGIVWANIHGSFVLLTVLLAIALVADVVSGSARTVPTGALLIASVLTPLVSPWGVSVYRYLWDLATSPVVRETITEWRPLPMQPAAMLIVAASLVGIGVAFVRHEARRPTLEEAATLAVFTALALWSGRNLLWWSVIVPPIVGGVLARWRPGGTWSRLATRVVALSLGAAVALGAWRTTGTPVEQLRTEAPPGISAWLATHPQDGRVFAEWWGGWFEYAVPQVPMFVDARVELFPSPIWEDYFSIVDVDPDWRSVIDRWGIRTIILARGHHPALEQALRSDPSWTLMFEDADGYVFTASPTR